MPRTEGKGRWLYWGYVRCHVTEGKGDMVIVRVSKDNILRGEGGYGYSEST